MDVYFKKKKIKIPVRSVSIYSTGLIFRTRNTENLLFSNLRGKNMSLTALFVFFPFLILWLDGKRVVDFRVARPFQWKISSNKTFLSVVEVPFNSKNRKIVEFFVGKRKI